MWLQRLPPDAGHAARLRTLLQKFLDSTERKFTGQQVISVVFLAIIIMVLFLPIAVGLALFIIVPDWFQENRNAVIIGIGIADFLLFAAIALLLFGL